MSCRRPLVLAFVLCIVAASAAAQTGTFIDRAQSGDLRIVSYNVFNYSIFPGTSMLGQRFGRVLRALAPDVVVLQEVSSSVTSVTTLLNSLAPLPGGASWQVHTSGDNAIASVYPLTMKALNTNPPKDATAIALVDLPDDRFSRDLYVMGNHFTCCNVTDPPAPLDSREAARQREADALANWIRDARTPGEFVDLPLGTPMIVAGDLNTINPAGVLHPLETILTGDVYDETTFGADAPPDWDLSSFVAALPLHNARGPDDYTWRNDNDQFDPGVLDHIIYSPSVLDEVHKFVLNTVAMTSEERLATGLEEFDVTLDSIGANYDHLPVVADFRLRGSSADFNDDGSIDGADLLLWQRGVGSTNAARAQGDADLDFEVTGEDLAAWMANFGQPSHSSSLAGAQAVPEPVSAVLGGLAFLTAVVASLSARTSLPTTDVSARLRRLHTSSPSDIGRSC